MNKNKSVIDNNSNHNLVLQGCDDVTINPISILSQENMLKELAKTGNFSAIQTLARAEAESFGKIHPLYPDFSAKFDNSLKRLVSTPQTEEAQKKYPKKIKGSAQIDLKDFPGMDSSETLFDYAYRTQTTPKVTISSYEEFLGDNPDPFPFAEFVEGMEMIIYPPEFPEAIDASIKTDDVELPIKLRRIPCQQFGMLVFSGSSSQHGIQIIINYATESKQITAELKEKICLTLEEQLNTDRFIQGYINTESVTVNIGDDHPWVLTSSDDKLDERIYTSLPYIIRYQEALIQIQRVTGCKFENPKGNIPLRDYILAMTIEQSLNGKWFVIEETFDNDTRCNFDQISPVIIESSSSADNLLKEYPSVQIELLGQNFTADKCYVLFQNARINNIKSVRKHYYEKKNNILITIKPSEGNQTFNKLCKFENLLFNGQSDKQKKESC